MFWKSTVRIVATPNKRLVQAAVTSLTLAMVLLLHPLGAANWADSKLPVAHQDLNARAAHRPVQKVRPQTIVSPKRSGTPSAPVPSLLPPFKFLGWKYAKARGGDYLQHFLRAGARSAHSLANSAIPESSASPSTSRPLTQSSIAPPAPGFLSRPSLPAGFLPTGVATGDFNHDGHADWIVSNGGSNNLWVYLGNGDGTAALPTIIPLKGTSPVDIVTADLRKSGNLDLIIAEPDSNSVEVLLGNGDGTFGAGTLYTFVDSPATVFAADFNGDGKIDILVGLLQSSGTAPLAVLPGDGSGNFGGPILTVNKSSFLLQTIAFTVADFNKDGFPDVVILDGVENALNSFVNQGDGTFKVAQSLIGEGTPTLGIIILSLAAGDVNSDGCPDFVAGDALGNVSLFPGNCDGTFVNNLPVAESPKFGAGDAVQAVSLVDMNGDGKLDIVTSGIPLNSFVLNQGQSAGNLVSVLFGDGTGSFGLSHVFPGDSAIVAFSVVDLNGDGHPDVVSANQDSDSTTVFLNDGHGGFGDPQGGYVGYVVAGSGGGGVNPAIDNLLVPVDMKGAGKTDLVFSEFPQFGGGEENLGVILNDGTGHFGPIARYPSAFTVDSPPYDYKFADFRNTGKPDFLGVGQDTLVFIPNNGDGTFGAPLTTFPQNALGVIGLGDFNRDGKLDFVTAQIAPDSIQLSVFLGNGDGTFTPGQVTSLGTDPDGSAPTLVYVGDFNHDGKLDVIVWVSNSSPSSHNVYEVFGNGDGTFGKANIIFSGFEYFAMADLNHDGLLDIVEIASTEITNQNQSPAFAVYLGQPDGSFKFSAAYQPYSGVNARFTTPVIADFNGDGNLDIAAFQEFPGNSTTTFPSEQYLQILAGNGDGTFTPTYNIFPFHKPTVPQEGVDLNGDGRADLVEFDQLASSYHVFPAQTGSAFQINMNSDPVVGQSGSVILTLSVPSKQPTTIQLSSSDPAIQVSSIVQIPAGSVSTGANFQIAGSFNSSHVFAIQAQLGAETETTYGSQVSPGSGAGFQVALAATNLTAVPGGSTLRGDIDGTTMAGYSTTVQLTCQGLPSGAICQFGANPLAIQAGDLADAAFFINVSSGVPGGAYPFVINATDGTFSRQINATLDVGGFSISFSPTSQPVLPGGTVSYLLNLNSISGFSQAVNLSCGSLPPGVICGVNSPLAAGESETITLQIPSTLAQGTYTATVTGVSGPISQSQTVQFVVGGITASFSQTSATIPVSSNMNFTITINSQNSFTGNVSFMCPGTPEGVNCLFTPVQVIVPANGSASTTLNISVVTKPSTASLNNPTSFRRYPWSFLALQNLRFLLLIASLFALAASVLAVLHRKHPKQTMSSLRFSLVLFACALFVSMQACGGGGSGTGGTGGGSPAPPPSTPATVVVTIEGFGSNVAAINLGSITVTVP
jgi:hypothetical protein